MYVESCHERSRVGRCNTSKIKCVATLEINLNAKPRSLFIASLFAIEMLPCGLLLHLLLLTMLIANRVNRNQFYLETIKHIAITRK